MCSVKLLGYISGVIVLYVVFVFVIGPLAVIKRVIAFVRVVFVGKSQHESLWRDKQIRLATCEELKKQF